MDASPVLRASGLRRTVPLGSGERSLFADVTLALWPGQRVLVTGPSGSGKSSLLRCLVGLDPCQGRLELDGASLRPGDGPRLRAQVAYLAQTPRVRADTAMDYLDEPWRFAVHRGRPRDLRERDRLLHALGLLPSQLSTRGDGLSGGERKRLALVRALWLGPRALLLDEPSAGLDADRIDGLLLELDRYTAAGGAVVVVTHDLDAGRLRPDARWQLLDGQLRIATTVEAQP